MRYSRFSILQYIVMVPLTEISIRTLGLQRTWTLIKAINLPTSRKSDVIRTEVRNNIAELKRSMEITPMKNKCLARSLVLWWQLERRGLHASLNIGVRKKKMLKAHAWLEYEGRPLNADQRVRENYQSIAEFHQPKDMK